jgi:serine/threonine-protein kinase
MAGGASAVLTDRRVGTAMYMAPEAVRGETPGPGFDLWSTAIVMVEALSGRLPFASSAAALSSLERGRLPDWRAWLKAQPDALARTLAAALDADPARRPASAAEFLDRLTGL